MSLNKSIVEDAALEWFGALGHAVGHGPHLVLPTKANIAAVDGCSAVPTLNMP